MNSGGCDIVGPDYRSEPVYSTAGGDLIDRALGSSEAAHLLQDAILTFGRLALNDGHQRRLLICGPFEAVLSRTLSHVSDVPLQLGGEDEHLELEVRYYWPPDEPELASDHSILKYYDGQGTISYIDGVYPLLWGGANISEGRIQDLVYFERYAAEDFDTALADTYHLHPFNEATPQEVWQHPMLIDTRNLDEVAAMNSWVNSNDIHALPERFIWRDEAIRLMYEWTIRMAIGVHGEPSDQPPRRYTTPWSREIRFGSNFTGNPPPTMSAVMAGVYRQRYAAALEHADSAGVPIEPNQL